MPYYFACLEDELGLRRKKTEERAHISPASASSVAGEQGGKQNLPPHTHSFAHGWPHAQSGQSSADARSSSAALP